MSTTAHTHPLEIKDVDRAFYADRLADFLPARVIDVHAHVWRQEFVHHAHLAEASPISSPTWPERVAEENPIEDLLHTYRLLLPGQEVTPLIFGIPRRNVDLEAMNDYVSQVASQYRLGGAHATGPGRHPPRPDRSKPDLSGQLPRRGLPALIVSTPEWPAGELERRVNAGGFLGLKPYLSFAPPHIPADEVTIPDFLPHSHLQVADAHGWIVMLHIPRPARLRDPLNLAQMIEIERRYPHIHLIVAHIGRAYCPEDVGDAFDLLQGSEKMLFDFSAHTNAWVMERLIRAVGPRRILFGSDMPILRMRMRRICEGGRYVNLVPPGLYGDISGDPHMREVSQEEGARLSFFLYEELLAFRQAAEATGLGTTDLEDVFYNNAARLI